MVSTKSPAGRRWTSAPSSCASVEVGVEALLVGGVQPGLLHVGDQQGAVEAAGVALAAAQHLGGVAARREADQNALLRAPMGGDAVRIQVLLQLVIHHVGGQQEGQFAEFGEGAARSPMRAASGGASTTSISSASRRNFCGMLRAARLPVMRSTASCCSRMCCTLTAVMTAMP